MTPVVEIDSLAHGGAGVGRVDGQVVFCPGSVPGDRVRIEVLEDRGRYLRGRPVEFVTPSPRRTDPPCPVFGICGGCDWQMLGLPAQLEAKAEVVRSQLIHLGRVADPPVEATVGTGVGFEYRNRVDLRISGGKPALIRAGSHDPVVIDDCPIAVGPIRAEIAGLRPPPGADRATLRASVATGDKLVLFRVGGRWERGRMTEVVGGSRLRITGRAFFQVNTTGAEQLVRLADEMLGIESSDTLLDGYAGGGLFAATVGRAAGAVVAVENDRRALSDLAANAPHAEILPGDFERVSLPPVEAAVVDPPRTGLGGAGVAALVGSGPERVVYVSCDPASFARDVRLLGDAGYRLARVVPVDMFPQTHHVEVVGHLQR